MPRLGLPVAVMSLLFLLPVLPALGEDKGCCTPTSDPSRSIFTIGLSNEDDCANVGGQVTTQEGCEAQLGQGTVTVIGGTAGR